MGASLPTSLCCLDASGFLRANSEAKSQATSYLHFHKGWKAASRDILLKITFCRKERVGRRQLGRPQPFTTNLSKSLIQSPHSELSRTKELD